MNGSKKIGVCLEEDAISNLMYKPTRHRDLLGVPFFYLYCLLLRYFKLILFTSMSLVKGPVETGEGVYFMFM